MNPTEAIDLAVDITSHKGWGKNATPIDAWARYLEALEHPTAVRVLNTLATGTTAPTIAEFQAIYTRLNQPTVPHETCQACAGTGRIFHPAVAEFDRRIPEELRVLGLEQLSLLKERLQSDT
jgi:hypothetical protein